MSETMRIVSDVPEQDEAVGTIIEIDVPTGETSVAAAEPEPEQTEAPQADAEATEAPAEPPQPPPPPAAPKPPPAQKVSDPFQQTIWAYLQKRAEQDELFAETLKKPNKNIKDCCTFIVNKAKAGRCVGYDDSEVFGWAVHYYDEDNIEVGKPQGCKVVSNHHIANVIPEVKKPEVKKPEVKKPEVKKPEVPADLTAASADNKWKAFYKKKAVAVKPAPKEQVSMF